VNKQQKLKIALPILVVVMAFVWGPVFTGSGSKNKKNKNKKSVSVNFVSNVNSSDLVAMSRLGARKKVKTSYADWGRNPFMPGYDQKALVLEGIVWDETNPKAIINGGIFGIGDHAGLNRIIAIKKDSVVIINKTGTVELHLGEERQF